MTFAVLVLPYLAILLYAWDRRRSVIGGMVCVALAVLEVGVALHFWAAGVL